MTPRPWQMTPSSLRRHREALRTLHVVAYDIADDGRRRQVARVAEGLGHRAQQSLFLSNLSTTERAKAARRFERILDPEADTVIMVPVLNAVFQTLGKPVLMARPRLVIA